MRSPNWPPTIQECAALLRAREISPVELVETYLERIRGYDPPLRALIRVDAERALARAREVAREIERGALRSTLHGVPIAVKDSIQVAGPDTTVGARCVLVSHDAPEAAAVRRLRAAGAIVLGKTNMQELGAGSTTNNPFHGTVRNPWDHTGGSIRAPAACCGAVGLKPTNGALPSDGVVPTARSLDCVGPIAACVEDFVLLYETLIRGRRPAIPSRLPPRPRKRLQVAAYGESVAHGAVNAWLGLPAPRSVCRRPRRSARPDDGGGVGSDGDRCLRARWATLVADLFRARPARLSVRAHPGDRALRLTARRPRRVLR